MKQALILFFFLPLFALAQNNSIAEKYKKAQTYAQFQKVDSAFLMLYSLAYDHSFREYSKLKNDVHFTTLHENKKWSKLLTIVERNEINFLKLDQELILILDTVFKEDQNLRLQLPEIRKKFGYQSPELKKHWVLIEKMDSINLVKVSKILDTRGWLGIDVVGRRGNSALFLVIQHSPLETQIKYLPMMQEAANRGNAKWSSLALLEDRIFIRTGKKQIYGSQISRDKITKEYYVSPILNPGKVNERRQLVGLLPIEDYVKRWDIAWDSSEHIKRSNLSDKKKLTGVWKYINTTNEKDTTFNNKDELLVLFGGKDGNFQKMVNNKTKKGNWKVDRNKIYLTINEKTEVFDIHILIKNILVLIPTNPKLNHYKMEYFKQK